MDEDLLGRYFSGDVNDEERARIADWLDASPDNMRQFRSLRKLHDVLLWQLPEQASSQKGSRTRSRTLVFLKIAGAVALICIIARWLFLQRQTGSDKELHTVQVPAGQHIELQLSDGTNVWLNANSSIAFPDHFEGGERRVQLSGEGYFEVVSNPAKPFIVETSSYDVRVLGTEFDVVAYGADSLFQTLLVSGHVEVIDPGRESRIALSPNERVYVKDGQLIKSAYHERNQFSWKEGLIVFENEAFSSMIVQLERYFDVRIDVRKRRLLDRHYTGKFRISDGLEHILKVLSLNNAFHYRFEETDQVIID